MFWLFGQLVGVVIGLALVVGAIYGIIWLFCWAATRGRSIGTAEKPTSSATHLAESR